MKANREPRVPLSGRALEVLNDAAELSEGSGLVFPGARPGQPLSANPHAKLLRELGFGAVTHGFRSSFRDWASEQTHTPHAVMDGAGPFLFHATTAYDILRTKGVPVGKLDFLGQLNFKA